MSDSQNLSDAQRMILDKMISKKNSSTFVLLINDEQEAELQYCQAILKNKQASEEDVKKAKDKIEELYKAHLTCVHCGNVANVKVEDNKIDFACECKDAKKEVADKEAIIAQEKALENDFYMIQIAATNKGISLYKQNYMQFVKDREATWKKIDEEIMGAAAL